MTATDANSCTKVASLLINEPTKITVTTASTDVVCNGNNNGTVTASAIGGSGTYIYKWSNGGATALLSNVGAGTYTVTATDANGCTATSTSVVKEPTAIALTITKSDVKCFGNSNGTAQVAKF